MSDEPVVKQEPFDTRMIPVRYHMLKNLDISPRHALISIKSDGAGSREMELGSAAHAMVFNTERVVAAPMKRDDRSAKYQAFERENIGAMIVTQSDYEEASRIADAVRAYKPMREMLECKGVRAEQTVIWGWDGDPYPSRKSRGTPDLALPAVFVVDLKTSKNASPSKWPYLMRDYDIAGQLAWYSAIPEYTNAPDYYTCVIEKGTNIVQMYKVDDDSMRAGWDRNQRRLAQLREIEETGSWPAYSADEVLVVSQAASWPAT